MNGIDQKRLENLHNALDIQKGALDDAYNKKDYLSMVEYASNIEKLSYTIHFLKEDDNTGRGSMTKFVSTETIDKMASVNYHDRLQEMTIPSNRSVASCPGQARSS